MPLKVVVSGHPYNLQSMAATNLYTFLRLATRYSWSFLTLNFSGSSHLPPLLYSVNYRNCMGDSPFFCEDFFSLRQRVINMSV